MIRKWFFKDLSLSKKRDLKGLLFVLPFVLGMLLFFVKPIIQTFAFAFGNVSMSIENNGYVYEYQGLENFRHILFNDLQFIDQLTASFQSTIYIPFIVMVSFLIAVLLKDSFKGRGIYRVIFFLPVVISSGILPSIDAEDVMQGLLGSGIQVNIDSKNLATNLINVEFLQDMLMSLDMGTSFISYVMNAVKNIINIINNSGIQILIFLAALQTVSPSIYEAAKVEGATGWETFWKITIPMISPHILVVTIYTIIDSFVNVNNDMMTFLKNLSFKKFEFGLSAAATLIYLFFVAFVVGIFYFILSRFIFYNNKDS